MNQITGSFYRVIWSASNAFVHFIELQMAGNLVRAEQKYLNNHTIPIIKSQNSSNSIPMNYHFKI